ncbi:MAG: transglutaminase domain-containing protein [Clostridia bacterium]|nr:transglutaminase domain-containing protein [Clostridia bacterium]
MYSYADLKYLSVPLPEDITHAREYGDYDLALRLIERKMAGGSLPEALVKRFELEREILRLMYREYTIPEEEAFEELKDGLGDFTRGEFDELILNHDLDWAYVKGMRHIHRDSIANLYKIRDDLARRAYERGKRENPGGPSPILDAAIAEMKAKGQVTARFKMRTEMTIRPDGAPKPVRVWLPIPCEYAQVRNVRITACSNPGAHIDAPQALQRTVCMEGTDDQPFWVEYEYETCNTYMNPDPAKITEDQPTFYTEELPPHIRFTPYLRSLCSEIVGQETNPLLKAKLIYEYIIHHIQYSYMRAYFTMPMIPEHAAVNQRGDCGVQALLFITLCRIAGVPARWQSGLCAEPGDVGCHDWAQFYAAPYGWMFCDCSYGGSAVRRGMKEREDFYFCNIDPFRMPANAEYQHDFEIPPRFLRYDPYDNQLGEAEYADAPVVKTRRAINHRMLSISGLECCKERPEYV